ncbi:MAG: tetratricopeptide repeat protein, partial [bacterium]
LELEIAANSKIYVRMANLYGRQRRYGESVAALEKAVELEPSDVETQNRLATAYLLGDRFEDAERILKGIMVLDDQDAQAHNSLGWLALKRGDTEQAGVHLRKALESDPDFLEAYVNVGMMYKGLGDFLRAKKAFRTFLAKASNSDKPEVKNSIAQVERELKDLTTDR